MDIFSYLKGLFISKPTICKDNIVHSITIKPHYEPTNDVHYIIDISRLQFYYYGKCDDRYFGDCYFIPSEFQSRISQLLIPINDMLKNAHQSYSHKIPILQYCDKDLVFVKTSSEHNMFCKFRHHPINYNNKPSNEPYSICLCFGKKDNSFFEIYYNKFGYINRIELICWKQSILYKFVSKPFENKLQIVSAYKTEGLQKECIFDFPREERERRKNEYKWVCKNFPDLAPKSLGAYTKMKNARSSKYLEIEKAALDIGITI